MVLHLLATEIADNNEGILDRAGDQIHDGEGHFNAVHTVLDLAILEEGPEKHGIERNAYDEHENAEDGHEFKLVAEIDIS